MFDIYVLWEDGDREPLHLENVLDYEPLGETFLVVCATGSRWYLNIKSVRSIEINPWSAE